MKNNNETEYEHRSTHCAVENQSRITNPVNNTSGLPEPAGNRPRAVSKKQTRPQNAPSGCLLTAQQVAEKLGVKRSTAYQWAYERRLPTVKLGRALRFRESEIEKFIRRNERPAIRPSLDRW